MPSRIIMTIIVLLAPFTPALADFAMLPQDDPPTSQNSSDSPPADPSQRPAATKLPDKRNLPPAGHKIPLAVGFGEKVPLSFAVRQIVPPSLKVKYGDEAKSDAVVDWQGGREWPVVLRAAVRPLGLRVTVHGKSVSIDK